MILDMYRTLDPDHSKPGGDPSPFMQLILGNNDETLYMAIRRQAKAIFRKAFDAHYGRPSMPLFARALGRGAGPYFAFATNKYLAPVQGEAAITNPDRSAATLVCPFCRIEADTPQHLVACTDFMARAHCEYVLDQDLLACLESPPLTITTLGSAASVGLTAAALLKTRRSEMKKMRYALSPARRADPLIFWPPPLVPVTVMSADPQRHIAWTLSYSGLGMREMSAGDSGLTDALAYLGGFGTSLELQQCLRASVATWGLHNPKVILEHPESFPSLQQLRGQSLAIRYTKLIMDGGDNGDEILLKMFALASGSFIRIFDFSPRSPTGGGARIMLPTSPVVRASGTWSRSIPLGALVKYRTGSSPRTVTWRAVFKVGGLDQPPTFPAIPTTNKK